MKSKNCLFFQVMVDKIPDVDTQFLLDHVKSLQGLAESDFEPVQVLENRNYHHGQLKGMHSWG